MKRALSIVIAVSVLVLAVGAGVYAVRTRARASASRPTNVQETMPTLPAGSSATTGTPQTTPRGDVMIDPRRQQLIGVKTVSVVRQTIGQHVRAAGAVRYDETKQADVNVKVEGWIRDLYVDYTGQPIQRGQPLFTLYSPDLLNTQNEYLLALKTRDQMQQSTIADARERADALVASARQRLLAWDLPADDLQKLDETRRAVDAVVFRAPVSGFVVEKMAVKGLHVMPGQSLYKVSDIFVVWVEADVYESELAAIKVGDVSTVTVDAYPGESFTGRVIYLYPYLDDQTRTNKVRVQLRNRAGRLKPGMYAHVELTSRGRLGLVVPTNAVLDSGTEQVVFVAEGDGRFQPQKVKIGGRLGDSTEILEGLKEGQQVATGATFFLDSESQLRASLQGYEATAAPTAAAPAGTQITFRTVPDPPKTGDNELEATIKDPSGKPIDDAEVTVQFFMPAMPTMNMPAMKSDAKLAPAGGGVYRGSGQVMMAGRWDATVTVGTSGGSASGPSSCRWSRVDVTEEEYMRSLRSTCRRAVSVALVVLAAGALVASPAAAQTKAKAKPNGLDIMLMQPKDAKSGANDFEVMVKGADGKPISDADVSVLLVMPKTATMAEMRSEVKLKPTGNGMYMGSGNVGMAGKWNTTVMVMKSGKDVGQTKVTLTAK